MKETGILWDLDGTLLNTLEDLADGTNAAMDHFGFPRRTLEEVRRFVGNGAKRLLEQAVPEETPHEKVEEALVWFQGYYAEHCQIKTRPYEGVLEALRQLKTMGYPMAVVSNKPDRAVKPLAAEYFPGLYARGESVDCPRKPAPDMVFKAMEVLGIKKCIYVGDSEVDVLTAQNAGMPCLSVLWGFRDKEAMVRVGAKHFCDTPSKLVEMLTEMERNHGQ